MVLFVMPTVRDYRLQPSHNGLLSCAGWRGQRIGWAGPGLEEVGHYILRHLQDPTPAPRLSCRSTVSTDILFPCVPEALGIDLKDPDSQFQLFRLLHYKASWFTGMCCIERWRIQTVMKGGKYSGCLEGTHSGS